MKLNCPLCGTRDSREFYYKGDAVALIRPAPDASEDAWDSYMHLRDNPAGKTRDLWHHGMGCGAWLLVTRDTATHEIFDVKLVKEAGQ